EVEVVHSESRHVLCVPHRQAEERDEVRDPCLLVRLPLSFDKSELRVSDGLDAVEECRIIGVCVLDELPRFGGVVDGGHFVSPSRCLSYARSRAMATRM